MARGTIQNFSSNLGPFFLFVGLCVFALIMNIALRLTSLAFVAFLSRRIVRSILFANLRLFAGLIYRMVKPKVVLLIFVSGKIVLTGAKVRTDIYEAFENIYPVLTEFKKS